MFGAMRVGPMVRGLLTFLPGSALREDRHSREDPPGPEYYHEVWIKHLVLAMGAGMPEVPRTVAELGPGDSIGAGIAALLSGADRYFALDASRFTRPADNLRVFEAMVELFRRRAAPLRSPRGWPDYAPWLDQGEFPSGILTPARLERSLAPDRLRRIRQALAEGGQADEIEIHYIAPWDDAGVLEAGSIDFLFSHTVLQHVIDLEATQDAIGAWLKPGGWFSHQVDLTSMGLSKVWNGHFACPDPLWDLIKGRRKWLINRQPVTEHLGAIQRHGMSIAVCLEQHRHDGLPPAVLRRRLQRLDDQALTCSNVFLQGQRGACSTASPSSRAASASGPSAS